MTIPGPADLLAVYDSELRDEAEVAHGLSVDRDGPLLRAQFPEQRGFVTYRSLDDYTAPNDGERLDALIDRTVAHFRDATDVDSFEWKTRGHDLPVNLGARLLAHGFVAEEEETVMMGAAADLVTAVPLPPSVTIRQIGITSNGLPVDHRTLVADVTRMMALQSEVFDSDHRMEPEPYAAQLESDPFHTEAWVAEVDGEPIAAGRLEVVPGTGCAGLWGGCVRADWRGQGLYRALVAARAESAITKGVHHIYSDCTEFSRPILERSGLVKVTTTTPYVWTRAR